MRHARYLYKSGKPLISDRIDAWKLGPVIPLLYHNLIVYKNNDILNFIYDRISIYDNRKDEFFKEILDDESRNIINGVVKDYACWSANDLILLCTEKGSPWDKRYTGEIGVEITDDTIKQYHNEELVVSAVYAEEPLKQTVK